jgi:hypothetical protein
MLGLNTNMITNGVFVADTDPPTSWTAATSVLTSEGAAVGGSGYCMRVTESGSAQPGWAYQDITTKIGHFYKLTAYFKKGTADGGKILVGTTGDPDAIFISPLYTDAAWNQKTVGFTATATTTRITMESTDATAGEYSDFDEIEMYDESHSVQDMFYLGEIKIYTGTQPTEADDVVSGTLLVTISNASTATGLTFQDAASGVLAKTSAETWSGVCGNTGTAGWFRLSAPADLATDNTTDVRIDGAISTSGSQLNMSSLAFTSGATETISTFTITLPAS